MITEENEKNIIVWDGLTTFQLQRDRIKILANDTFNAVIELDEKYYNDKIHGKGA